MHKIGHMKPKWLAYAQLHDIKAYKSILKHISAYPSIYLSMGAYTGLLRLIDQFHIFQLILLSIIGKKTRF